MLNKFKKISLSFGMVAAVVAPVVASVSCGNKKTIENNNSTSQTELSLENKAFNHWDDNTDFQSKDAVTPATPADLSALKYIINDEHLNGTSADETLVAASTADETRIVNGTKEVIKYYTDQAFVDNRIEFEVVKKVKNIFKIRDDVNQNADTEYTANADKLSGANAEDYKVDVYGYEVTGTGSTNKVKLIGSSVPALSHAFYLYVKQYGYGLIDWADAQGGTWDTQNHSVHNFENGLKGPKDHSGNTLRIPGTVAGRAAGNGEVLASANRVVARSPYRKHYRYNNVTSAYTMAYWDKSQWEAELNWNAMHGYDLLLDPVATEAVQYDAWKKLAFNNDDATAFAAMQRFFTGPTFESWQRKGNMTNYDVYKTKEDFQAWNDKQVQLERFIKSKARERGISTIAQGFSGFIPKNVANGSTQIKADGVTGVTPGTTFTIASTDVYETDWSIGNPSTISYSSEHPHGQENNYFGNMLDPSKIAVAAVAATGTGLTATPAKDPVTAYQVIGNQIVKSYEDLILSDSSPYASDGITFTDKMQHYFNEDPFDEMGPMDNHPGTSKKTKGAPYDHTILQSKADIAAQAAAIAAPGGSTFTGTTMGYTGKKAFLSDLGYSLSKAVHGAPGHENAIVTNIAWQLTYGRDVWTRDNYMAITVGNDYEKPNFTPENFLVLSEGDDWNRRGNFCRNGDNLVKDGDEGFSIYKDGYSFAFFAGFQDYDEYTGATTPNGASNSVQADAIHTPSDVKRGAAWDYTMPRKGGGSYAFVPLVCLGAGNLPDGELRYFASGLTNVFYNINKYPGGAETTIAANNKKGLAANTKVRPMLDNFMAYGPAPEGHEQNAIIHEVLADMGWRQEPLGLKKTDGHFALAAPKTAEYEKESTVTSGGEYLDDTIFKAYLGNYAWNRYGFNDSDMVDFLWKSSNDGIYSFVSGNPRHAFEFTFSGQASPWAAQIAGKREKVFEYYGLFTEIAKRHQKDAHHTQLFIDDTSLYALNYLGLKFDDMVAEMKNFVFSNLGKIHDKTTVEYKKLQMYRKMSKWYHHVMDKLMAGTTLWRLERWVDFAKEWGDTPEQKAFFASDAKRLLTVWGPDTITDYATRAWQGLINYQYYARDHAYDLYQKGKDPIAWQPHAQYLWSEEKFEQPIMDDAFWGEPFSHPYNKAVELLTMAPRLTSNGDLKNEEVAIAQAFGGLSFIGTKVKDANGAPEQVQTVFGPADKVRFQAQVTISQLESLKGCYLDIQGPKGLESDIVIDSIKVLDASGTEHNIWTDRYTSSSWDIFAETEVAGDYIDSTLKSGGDVYVDISKHFKYTGGNNGDLFVVIEAHVDSWTEYFSLPKGTTPTGTTTTANGKTFITVAGGQMYTQVGAKWYEVDPSTHERKIKAVHGHLPDMQFKIDAFIGTD